MCPFWNAFVGVELLKYCYLTDAFGTHCCSSYKDWVVSSKSSVLSDPVSYYFTVVFVKGFV